MTAQQFAKALARRLARTAAALALAAAVAGSLAAAAPAQASPAAACQRHVAGTWHTSQTNDYHVTFSFQQHGTSVSGTASIPEHERARAGYTSPVGSVSGTVVGDQIDVVVTWSHPHGPVRGRYYGTVSGHGINGGGYNLAYPTTTKVAWTGTGSAACR